MTHREKPVTNFAFSNPTCTATAWQIKAVIAKDDASIFIDFDQKDGSGESFTGKWVGNGIEFPDGNVWTRKELSTIP